LHGIEVFASSNDRYNYYTFHKAIQPRFGFAYQLPHAFVVRGGYGIYFSTRAAVPPEQALGASRVSTFSRPG